MTTKEGQVKILIKNLLQRYDIISAKDAGKPLKNAAGWYYMPSQNALGVKGIPDFIGAYRTIFWAIEAKAPGKTPSGFQKLQINLLRSTGSAVFMVDSLESLREFEVWLKEII